MSKSSALVIGGTSGIGSMIASVLESISTVTRVGRAQWDINSGVCPYDLGSYDVLVLAAGIDSDGDKNFLDQDINDITLTLNTNLISNIKILHQYCLARKEPGRVIVVGSSHSAERIDRDRIAYCLSRWAMRQFVTAARHEIKAKSLPIRLLLLRPGCTRTNFFRNKHKGQATQEQENQYYQSRPHHTLDELQAQIKDIVLDRCPDLQEVVITPSPL